MNGDQVIKALKRSSRSKRTGLSLAAKESLRLRSRTGNGQKTFQFFNSLALLPRL